MDEIISIDRYLLDSRLGQSIDVKTKLIGRNLGLKSPRLTIALARITSVITGTILNDEKSLVAAEFRLNSISPSPDTKRRG